MSQDNNVITEARLQQYYEDDSLIHKSISKYITDICFPDKNKKQKDNITNCLKLIIIKHKLSLSDIKELMIKRTTFPMFKEGNIWEQSGSHFGDKFIPFFKSISQCCPKGLNTSPNAASGKFELLWRLCRSSSKQPSCGDILDIGELIEIKGETGKSGGGIRLFKNDLLGTIYCQKGIDIFGGHFDGNTTTTKKWKNKRVYEIDKPKYEKHYEREFHKNIPQAKKCMNMYLKNLFDIKNPDDHVSTIFPNDKFSWKELYNVLIGSLYESYKMHKGFDHIYIFGDGSNLKIIKDVNDLKKLNYENDYFRIGQNFPVGYYVN
jgi:hypothetical protein